MWSFFPSEQCLCLRKLTNCNGFRLTSGAVFLDYKLVTRIYAHERKLLLPLFDSFVGWCFRYWIVLGLHLKFVEVNNPIQDILELRSGWALRPTRSESALLVAKISNSIMKTFFVATPWSAVYSLSFKYLLGKAKQLLETFQSKFSIWKSTGIVEVQQHFGFQDWSRWSRWQKAN